MLSEAFVALRRNTWMSFAAITTSCMALFLIGGMAFAYLGVQQYADSLPDRFEMRVFLRDDVTKADVETVRATIRKIQGVNQVEYLPREQAWEQFKREMPEVTAGIENPLPEAFNITLTDVKLAGSVAASIQSLEQVAESGVKYESEAGELISDTLALLRWVGSALGGLMLVTAGVLIYNAIRLTIVARRREISIMRLVGATRLTIVTPLLIEGVIQGLVGGLFASALILAAHQVLARLLVNIADFIQLGALEPRLVFGSICLLGAAYGLLCSLLAVRDPRGIA